MNETFSAIADSLPRVAALIAATGAIALGTAWLCCIAWAWKDARSRTGLPLAQLALVTPVVAGGLVGLPIYLAARPLRRRSDAQAADSYLEVLLQRIEEHGRYCGCGSAVRPDWVYCPTCSLALQSKCSQCGAHGPTNWLACAYCGADHGDPKAAPRLLPMPAPQHQPLLPPAAAVPAPAPAGVAARAEVTA